MLLSFSCNSGSTTRILTSICHCGLCVKWQQTYVLEKGVPTTTQVYFCYLQSCDSVIITNDLPTLRRDIQTAACLFILWIYVYLQPHFVTRREPCYLCSAVSSVLAHTSQGTSLRFTHWFTLRRISSVDSYFQTNETLISSVCLLHSSCALLYDTFNDQFFLQFQPLPHTNYDR